MAVAALTRCLSELSVWRLQISMPSRRLLNLHSGNTSIWLAKTRLIKPPPLPLPKLCGEAWTESSTTAFNNSKPASRIVDDHQRLISDLQANVSGSLLLNCFNSASTTRSAVSMPLRIYATVSNPAATRPIICPTGRLQQLPLGRLIKYDDNTDAGPQPSTIGEAPGAGSRPVIEKRAARILRIRRKKMKKHKLRKLRKRMFFVNAKNRQRREARKEKIFQDELLDQMSRADEFDARAWVQEFLLKATTDPQTLLPKKPKRFRPTRYVL